MKYGLNCVFVDEMKQIALARIPSPSSSNQKKSMKIMDKRFPIVNCILVALFCFLVVSLHPGPNLVLVKKKKTKQ